jgi:TetR/AcrR family transcriptional repressor of mexJK operon
MEDDAGAPPRAQQGRPRHADIEIRERYLLDCAAVLFIDLGYHKVSLATIAREARVAVRTIYVKFGGKAGLFNAVLQAHRDRLFMDLPPLDAGGRALDAILGDFARHFLRCMTSERALALQRRVIADALDDPSLSPGFMQAGVEPVLLLLAEFFSRPDVACQLRTDLPPKRLARHFLSCLMGDHLCWLLEASAYHAPDRAEAAVGDAVRLFLDGCRQR